ncbi:hypothetical protein [Burkholderia cepacia]|uniref:hypothetical protein n=1 Tax=Burkholderia cepacia TaxID=292 RepID=UPI0012D927C7|nr:hypothetical protein [Burkholderia cepacia]
MDKWLSENFSKIWHNSSIAPRILGRRATTLAEQEEFHQLGEILVKRMFLAMEHAKPIEFHLLDRAESGAWVIWPAQCYGVLLTRGLVQNIQVVCGQAERLLGSALRDGQARNFLSDLWGKLPNDKDHRTAFGGLLAQVAFAFVVHHELAHAGLGHEGAVKAAYTRSAAKLDDHALFDGLDILDEWAAAAAEHDLSPERRIRSQALEADADVNGLIYTRQFMLDQAREFQGRTVACDDSMGVVWKALLNSGANRGLVVCIGVTIGLLSLLPDFALKELGNLDVSTHPPIPARILTLLHIDRQLDTENSGRDNMTNAILIAAALIDMVISMERLNAEGSGALAASNLPTENAPASSLDRALERISIPESVSRFDDIGAHMKALALEMKSLERTTSQYCRFPHWMRFAWYLS